MTRWLLWCTLSFLSVPVYGQDTVSRTRPGDVQERATAELFTNQAGYAASIQVSVERALLGAPFTVVVVVVGARDSLEPRQFQPTIPTSLDLGAAFDIGQRLPGRRTRINGMPAVEFQLELTSWQVGEQLIPPIPVDILTGIPAGKRADSRGNIAVQTGGMRIHTPPTPLSVIGLVGDGDARIRDIPAPLTIVRQRRHPLYRALIGLGLALAGVAILWILLRLYRRRASQSSHHRDREASRDALTELRMLAMSGALEVTELRPAFERMSEIVRAHFVRQLQLSSAELTSAELLQAIRANPRSTSAVLDNPLQSWLAECDLVKFADARPSSADAQEMHRLAVELVTRANAVYVVPEDEERARGESIT